MIEKVKHTEQQEGDEIPNWSLVFKCDQCQSWYAKKNFQKLMDTKLLNKSKIPYSTTVL